MSPIPTVMRPRAEAAFVLGGVVVVAALVAILARGNVPDRDPRASTFRTGPLGSKALLDASQAMGVPIQRFRQRPQLLPQPDSGRRTLLVILDPPARLSSPEITSVMRFSAHADLLLAGEGTEGLMRCFGYEVKSRLFDSTSVLIAGAEAPVVSGTLVATEEPVRRDSSRADDGLISECTVPTMRAVTPLLASKNGDVALRLERSDVAHTVALVADANLFRNRPMRETGAGPFALGLIVNGYDLVIFDEYHQGYGASGSLAGETLAWSAHSPWGWAVWQLAVVGFLVLLAGGIRFGPIRRQRYQPRRSSLEHVRALATALSATDGSDEAIAAQVRGLRRRLSVSSVHAQSDWREWLDHLRVHASTPSTASAVTNLQRLTVPGQGPASVLSTANAVEDVWESLHQ